MTNYEITSIILSIIAIIISMVSFKKSDKLNMASIELYINERITNTKEKVYDISMQMATSLDELEAHPKQKEAFNKIFEGAVENNLNAYEEACTKYLDKKIDRKRFKKNYQSEIRNLVQNKQFAKYYDTVTSKYRATLKVYKLWEDSEN